MCNKVKAAVSQLPDAYPDRVEIENLDATTPENEAICQELGFKNHGLVIRSPGGSETLWTQPDHEVDMNDVRSKLSELIPDS